MFPFVGLMCVSVPLHTHPGIEFSHHCSNLHTCPHGSPVWFLRLGVPGHWGPQPGSVYPALPSTTWPLLSSGISCVCCHADTTAALVSSYPYVFSCVSSLILCKHHRPCDTSTNHGVLCLAHQDMFSQLTFCSPPASRRPGWWCC